MALLQYNVGTFKGLNGTAVVYLAKTTGGSQFLTYQATVAGVDEWMYLSRSGMQSIMAGGDGSISSNIDMSKLADVAPAGVLDSEGYVLLDNAADKPRLYTGQAFYSIAGEGVAEYTADTGTPVTGNGGGSGTPIVINSVAKSFSETISEGVTWVSKNPIALIGIAFLISELLGLTNVLGLKKKKRVAARRR